MLRKQKEDSGLEDPSCCSKGLFQDRRGTRGKTLCDRILSASAHPLFSDCYLRLQRELTKQSWPNRIVSSLTDSPPLRCQKIFRPPPIDGEPNQTETKGTKIVDIDAS